VDKDMNTDDTQRST